MSEKELAYLKNLIKEEWNTGVITEFGTKWFIGNSLTKKEVEENDFIHILLNGKWPKCLEIAKDDILFEEKNEMGTGPKIKMYKVDFIRFYDYTIADVKYGFPEDYRTVCVGITKRSPIDLDIPKVGNKNSLTNALKKSHLPKKVKAAIWEKYLEYEVNLNHTYETVSFFVRISKKSGTSKDSKK